MRFYSILLLTLLVQTSSFDFISQQSRTKDYYFPSANASEWETKAINELTWNPQKLDELIQFVKDSNSGSLLILHKGKIVVEEYFRARRTAGIFKKQWEIETADPIFSAQKSVKAFVLGLAIQEKLLKLDDKVSKYLEVNWTNESPKKYEELVTIKHLLSMTSGLNKSYLFEGKPGEIWHYSQAYDKVVSVLERVYNQEWETIVKQRLFDRIGMKSAHIKGRFISMNSRDMARFGLMVLSGGRWNQDNLVAKSGNEYFNSMLVSSSEHNPSYGFLWWLNASPGFRAPGKVQGELNPHRLIPQAPKDLFAAMGFGEKRIYIVPSQDLVIVRHGVPAQIRNSGLVMLDFDRKFWSHFANVYSAK